jgi:CheY-like chemotaxis protein
VSKVQKVLIVEDNDELCDLLSFHISELGPEVITANDISTAQALIESHDHFDAILIDLHFPGPQNGLDLVTWTRGLENTYKAKSRFILMTGQLNSQDTEEAHLLGVTQFLPKPFDSILLQDILNSVFTKKSLAA